MGYVIMVLFIKTLNKFLSPVLNFRQHSSAEKAKTFTEGIAWVYIPGDVCYENHSSLTIMIIENH